MTILTDVDIIFHDEKDFLPTLCTTLQNTKTPFVLTASTKGIDYIRSILNNKEIPYKETEYRFSSK